MRPSNNFRLAMIILAILGFTFSFTWLMLTNLDHQPQHLVVLAIGTMVGSALLFLAATEDTIL